MKKPSSKSTAVAVEAEVLPPETAPKAEISACNALHRLVTGRAEEARKVAETACHYAVLLGTKLKALKEATPHGGWEVLFSGSEKRIAGGSSKANEKRFAFEFSSKTAANYIAAASGALDRPGLPSHAKKKILALAAKDEIPETLPEAEAKALDAATRGETLRQLYIDLGVLRMPATKQKGMGGNKERKEKTGGDEADEIYRLFVEGLADITSMIEAGDLGKLRPPHLAELETLLRGYLDKLKQVSRK